jgi:hypothetical protein
VEITLLSMLPKYARSSASISLRYFSSVKYFSVLPSGFFTDFFALIAVSLSAADRTLRRPRRRQLHLLRLADERLERLEHRRGVRAGGCLTQRLVTFRASRFADPTGRPQ